MAMDPVAAFVLGACVMCCAWPISACCLPCWLAVLPFHVALVRQSQGYPCAQNCADDGEAGGDSVANNPRPTASMFMRTFFPEGGFSRVRMTRHYHRLSEL